MTELQKKIMALKKERGALILAHYYQPAEIREIADHVGDSFALAKIAQSAAEKDIIVCGVRFMAESAKILNPGKNVYLPAPEAGCPMADQIGPEEVLALKREHPGAAVVCYVNSTAEVKAVSDICCTSSSAEKVVASLEEREIIFIPDRNLGGYVARAFPEKSFVIYDGCCPIHDALTVERVEAALTQYPESELLAHPECPAVVLEKAHYIGSTAGIIQHGKESSAGTLIIATEREVCDILQKALPEKKLVPADEGFVCRDMKKTGLEDVLACLEGQTQPLSMDEDLIKRAARSLERMVAVG